MCLTVLTPENKVTMNVCEEDGAQVYIILHDRELCFLFFVLILKASVFFAVFWAFCWHDFTPQINWFVSEEWRFRSSNNCRELPRKWLASKMEIFFIHGTVEFIYYYINRSFYNKSIFKINYIFERINTCFTKLYFMSIFSE